MAPKNIVAQSSRKTALSTFQGSTITSATSGSIMTRSTAKASAALIKEQAVVVAASQSRKSTNGDSKVADGVSQIASHAVKQKSTVGFNMPQTIPCRMDEL